MKERILMIRMEYSVLKEKMKENECGWSDITSWADPTTGGLTGDVDIAPARGIDPERVCLAGG
jgi:hypothetical protein